MDQGKPSKAQIAELLGEHIERQYDRKPDVPDASAGLERLHDELVAAARSYDSGLGQQRQAVCDAIMVTSEFLKEQGFGDAALVPLSRVVWALAGLCESNRPDPLFCEKMAALKPRRSMEKDVQQGHLAALVDAWLRSSSAEEGREPDKLRRAARHMSGAHFGKLDKTQLQSARSYNRRAEPHGLLRRAYDQMSEALSADAEAAGGGAHGLRRAVESQIDALNLNAER